MPNRILKESICTSDNINALSWLEEVVFYRLIVNCDDYGRFDARAAILKSRLFPLRDDISAEDVNNAIQRLAQEGLIILYTHDDKPYLQITTWSSHQQIRNKKSKFPAPNNENLQLDINCNQLISDDCNCSRNPIQSESKSESESKSKSESESESESKSESKSESNSNSNSNSKAISNTNTKTNKQTHGEFENVLLTTTEFEKLGKKMGVQGRTNMIERLSSYMASKGINYQNHYATIISWWNKKPPDLPISDANLDQLAELEKKITYGC